jgi:hypothetical protein
LSITDVGRTNFQNGMRVAREHLEHLQNVLQIAGEVSRQSAGLGKVCFGLRVQALDADHVSVDAGAAFDRQARVLVTGPQKVALTWKANAPLYLVLTHALRGEAKFQGVPTLYYDEALVGVRAIPPPYDDEPVVFAQLDRGAETVEVTQLGEWYLPPQDHTHSGEFGVRDGLWRYDGAPLGHPPARFDSGFVPVAKGAAVTLKHGLGDADLLVQLQARGKDGVVTSAGFGTSFWYELADPGEIRLACAKKSDALELRAMVWPQNSAAGGPLLPLANPGPDLVVDAETSFTLDAGDSRAFGGKHLTKFIWTEIN